VSLAGYSLDGKRMRVVTVGSDGGVDCNTVFDFRQSHEAVWAFYAGGNIVQGFLIGTIAGTALEWEYLQLTRASTRDKGTSSCMLFRVPDSGLLRLTESFRGLSRYGSGVNVLEEIWE
jgi:hypothetical protein